MNTVHATRVVRGVCSLLLFMLSFAALADVFRPAYLELREIGGDQYDVLWKVPAQGEARLAVTVRLPADARQLSKPQGFFNDGSFVERWRIERPGGLAGATLRVDGIAASVTDVIVRIERQDGTSQVERLLPSRPEFTVQAASGVGEVAWSYFVLGVEHILGGVDHLLFVLALLLIVRGGRRIVATITAFTIAHSITLVSATLGWVHVAGPPVEATIALSIVFVAAEVLHGLHGKPGSDGARALGRRLHVRAAARLRLRGRTGAGGPAAEGDPGRAADVQRRRRGRPAAVRRRRARCTRAFCADCRSVARHGLNRRSPTRSAASRCSG